MALRVAGWWEETFLVKGYKEEENLVMTNSSCESQQRRDEKNYSAGQDSTHNREISYDRGCPGKNRHGDEEAAHQLE